MFHMTNQKEYVKQEVTKEELNQQNKQRSVIQTKFSLKNKKDKKVKLQNFSTKKTSSRIHIAFP